MTLRAGLRGDRERPARGNARSKRDFRSLEVLGVDGDLQLTQLLRRQSLRQLMLGAQQDEYVEEHDVPSVHAPEYRQSFGGVEVLRVIFTRFIRGHSAGVTLRAAGFVSLGRTARHDLEHSGEFAERLRWRRRRWWRSRRVEQLVPRVRETRRLQSIEALPRAEIFLVIETEARQRQEEHDADHPLHALLDAQYSQFVTCPCRSSSAPRRRNAQHM